jgi:tape measure domain-containing protein
MDPAAMMQQARQQKAVPPRTPIAGLLPSYTSRGVKEEIMRQLGAGGGGGGPSVAQGPGRLALTDEMLQRRINDFEVRVAKVREIFDPREFEFATLRLFRAVGDALEQAANQAEQAAQQAKSARIDSSVDALMRSIDNEIKVAQARVRVGRGMLTGQAQVSDLGRTVQPALPPTRIAGLLPPAVGRAPNVYSTSGESQTELFARREREARMRSLFGSEPQLMLPPARPRQLGAPPLYQAPSLPPSGESAYLGGRTGSSVRTRTPGGFIGGGGPSGGGAEANAFVDASRNALAYSQALTGLRESIKGVQAGQLPLVGGIKALAGEFGQATKQVLLYGTAYKGLAFLTSLPGEAFNAAKALGTYKNQLQAVTSETGTFSKSLAFVDNLSQRFNVPLESARQGFVKLHASMQPAGFSQEQIEGLFTGVSQATAAFGLSADKVDRVNYAFAQMASKGQIMSEELKGQLGDVLPGALSLFAEAAKMSIPEFSKAMEDGAFKGEAMMQVLENVGILMKVKFGAAAAGAAKTLQGALNGIQNNLKLMYEAFGPVVNRMAAVFGPQIASLIKNVTDVVKAFEVGISKTGDSFAAMSPQAQGFYSSIQGILPSIKSLVPSFIAAAQNIGYFASSLATASQPLLGLLKLSLDFISIPFVARVGVYATIIGLLTSAFTLLKNTGIIQATIAMIRFIATLTVGQVQAWIASIQAGIAALVAMARTANIAKLSLMALKVTLISFGVGAVLVGLDFVAQKLLNIGSAADDAKRRAAELTDELARAVETGNVALTSAKLVETETKVQSLQESKKILQRLQGGGEVSLSAQDYQRLQRAGLAQGVSQSLDPLTGQPTGKGRAAGGSSQINESLKVVQSGLVSALNDAGRAEEANADALQVQGNMQRELQASRSQMKDIPPPTGADGAGGATAADKAEQERLRIAAEEQRRRIEAANHGNALMQINFQKDLELTDAGFEHKKNMIDALHAYEMSGLNDMEARQKKFEKDLEDVQMQRVDAVRKALQKVVEAQVATQAAANVASVAGAPAAPTLPAPAGAGPSFRVGQSFQGFQVTDVPGSSRAYRGGTHEGYDVATPIGTALSYAIGGVVKSINRVGKGNAGKTLEVQLDNGIVGMSMHLNEVLVEAGQRFQPGQLLARTGATGAGTGPHLHQESAAHGYKAGRAGDSMAFLQLGKGGASRSSTVNTMARRETTEARDVETAQARQRAALSIAELDIQNKLALAYQQTATIIKQNIDSIYPIGKITLENKLSQIRHDLQMQNMPEEMIAYEEKRAAAVEEGAMAEDVMKNKLKEAKTNLTEYTEAKKKSGDTSKEVQGQIALLTAEVKLYEDSIASLPAKQKELNIAMLEGAIAALKNADALKAQQDTMGLIKSSVESATSSYKGFMKEVIMGGDPAEALKKFQEALTDQVLTVFLDFAMKPVEDMLKNQLSAIFGIKTEEQAREEAVKKMEDQLKELKASKAIQANIDKNVAQLAGGAPAPEAPETPKQAAFSAASALPRGIDTSVAFGGTSLAPGAEAMVNAMNGIDYSSIFKQSTEAMTSSLAESATTSFASLGFSLNDTLSKTLEQAKETTDTKGAEWQKSLGTVVGAIGIAAGAIMGIAAGISQIKKGGAGNTLMGIGSIMASVGGAIGGFSGLIPKGGKAANGAVWTGGFQAFANGGMVKGPTLGLIGEGKYNEAIVPLPDGRSIPVQMRGTGGTGSRDLLANQAQSRPSPSVLSMSFQSTTINGVEYVDRAQLEAAMEETRRAASREGASKGANLAIDRLANSPSSRRRAGIR